MVHFPTANMLLSSSNRHFWTSKLANRRVNSAMSTQSFSANCAHGNTTLEICLFIVWENGQGFFEASNSSTGTILVLTVPLAACLW